MTWFVKVLFLMSHDLWVMSHRFWILTCFVIVLYLMEVVTTEEDHDSFWGDDYISYTIEGKFLTISCIVRGSEGTQFRWFKDGMLIDMDVAARKGFQTIINSKLDGTIRSVLYYGNVKASDRGRTSWLKSVQCCIHFRPYFGWHLEEPNNYYRWIS